MTIWPLIWATTSNPLAHTEGSHTALRTLTPQTLLSACCMPCTVLDWGPQANLGELTHCSGPQMTSCPGVTCYCWEAVTPADCHIPWGSHSPRQSPHWFFGFHDQPSLVDRLHYPPATPASIGPQTWWYPLWPHEGASAPQLLPHSPAGSLPFTDR